MPAAATGYPSRDAVIAYLAAYEARYALPVRRPWKVVALRRGPDALRLEGADGAVLHARHVINATGNWSNPHIPGIPGRKSFRGRQVHSAHYRDPHAFAGASVLIVGGGNSGAQILAEVSRVAARTTWVTEQPPVFLPDDVDGATLFQRATERLLAMQAGREPPPQLGGLGSIVMVPPVREARARGVLAALPALARLDAGGAIWPDGSRIAADAIIWCTGFRPALGHLAPLGLTRLDGLVAVSPLGQALEEPRLWLLGHGDWTGFASATLAGVTRPARALVRAIAAGA